MHLLAILVSRLFLRIADALLPTEKDIVQMTKISQSAIRPPSQAGVRSSLQRRCASGGNGGDCAEYRKRSERLQCLAKSITPFTARMVVQDQAQSTGEPLGPQS